MAQADLRPPIRGPAAPLSVVVAHSTTLGARAASSGGSFAGGGLPCYTVAMTLIPADPFARGRAAFRLGIPRDAAPYPWGAECNRWKKGWDAGFDSAYPGRRYN